MAIKVLDLHTHTDLQTNDKIGMIRSLDYIHNTLWLAATAAKLGADVILSTEDITLTENPSSASTNVMVALYSRSFPCRTKRLSRRVRSTNCINTHNHFSFKGCR